MIFVGEELKPIFMNQESFSIYLRLLLGMLKKRILAMNLNRDIID
jgi:hypothetical protein